MGGLNFTPHLVNQLMNLFPVSEPCVTSMLNPNINLGFQILTLGIQPQNHNEQRLMHLWAIAKLDEMLNLLQLNP